MVPLVVVGGNPDSLHIHEVSPISPKFKDWRVFIFISIFNSILRSFFHEHSGQQEGDPHPDSCRTSHHPWVPYYSIRKVLLQKIK